MATTKHNLGELGIVSAGMGILIKLLPMVAAPPLIPVGLIGIGTICGMIYMKSRSGINQLWNTLNIIDRPKLINTTDDDNNTTYTFRLPIGQSPIMYIQYQEQIEMFLGAGVEITGDVSDRTMRIVSFKKRNGIYKWKPIKTDRPMEIVLGYDRYGELVTLNLGSGTEPHVYICGTAGCGKSNELHCIITNLLLYNDVELWLGDLKGGGVELGIYEHHPKVLGLATNIVDMEHMIDEIFTEVDRRYQLFAEYGVRTIQKYNQKIGADIKHRALVIDEFAELMYGKENKEMKGKIERISARARACGIHMILATQRPDSEVVTGKLKANIANAFGMATVNRVNSEVILDHGGCELLEVGQGILRKGIKEILVYTPLIDTDEAEVLINESIEETL